MPSWKKVIVSGSNASLNSLNAPSITGSLQGTASFAITSSYSIYAETSSLSNSTLLTQLLVINQTGTTINKGVVVRVSGSNNASDIPRITTASYESDAVSANTLGITSQQITNGSQGYVITEGVLTGIDTTNYTSGTLLFLGATGSITNIVPVAPLHAVRLGQVIRQQSNNGSMTVRVDNGYELDELHDVLDNTTTSSYGDLLVRSGSVWTNSNQLTGSYAITGSLTVSTATINGNTTVSNGLVRIQGNSSNELVRITQLGAGNALVVEDSTNPDSTPFVIDSSGNVGIGTTAPSASLHIKPLAPTTSGQNSIMVESNAGTGINLISDLYNTNQSVTTFGRLQSSMAAFLAYGVNQTGSNTTAYQSSQDVFAANPTALELGNGYFALKYNTTSSTRTIGTNVPMATSLYMNGGNGRIGIGTVTPQAIFHVSSSGYNEQYPFLVGFNALSVSSSGNVGIGTNIPAGNLEVYGVSDSVALVNSAGNSYLKLRRGSISADAHISFDTTTTQKHIIGLINSTDSLILGGTEASPVITISGSNVGIGTSNPIYLLEVKESASTGFTTLGRFIGGANATGNGGGIIFGSSQTETGAIYGYQRNQNSGDLVFMSRDNAQNLERMRITNTGNVGIGTTAPSASLHVFGNTLISGSLTVASSSAGPNENTLTLGARDSVNEGGQIGFNAPGGSYTSASFIDLYQNRLRVLKGTNAGSTGEAASWNMQTLQAALPAYTSATSFPGTVAGYLAFDVGGNLLTTSGVGSAVNIGNSDLTITTNATRVLSHSGTSRFIISGSSSNSLLEYVNSTTGNSRGMLMQQQLNGEANRTMLRAWTAAGNNGDSSTFNGWASDHIVEYVSGSGVAPSRLKGWGWSYYNGAGAYTDILLISTSKEVRLSGSLTVTGSILLPGTTQGSYGNVVLIDTGSGRLYYTASSAIGGGSSGNAFPYTGSALITGSLGVTGSLNILTPAIASSTESLATFRVDDDINSYFRVYNATATNSSFVPAVEGKHSGTNVGLYTIGNGTTDTGANPLTVFDSRIGASAVVTRPLFQWRNYGTAVMTIDSAGKLGINTTTPNADLDVNGNAIITGTLNVTAGITASLQGTASFATTASYLSGSITGSGTVNYISKFTGSATLANSLIQDNGTTLAIGSSPTANYMLSVTGNSNALYGIFGRSLKANGFGGYFLGTNGVSGEANGNGGSTSKGGQFSAYDSTNNIGITGNATIASFGATTNIGGQFSADSATNNYSVQLVDGTEAAGKVLVSQTSDGKANWSTQLSGSYGLTGSLTLPLSSSLIFSSSTNNLQGRVYVSNLPNPAGTSTTSSPLNNTGFMSEGLYLQYGYTNDQGGIKITDDGVSVFGAGDTGLFRVVNEDTNQQILIVTGELLSGTTSNAVGINKPNAGVGDPTTIVNATLDVNGSAIITGSLTVTGNLGGSSGSIDMNAMIQASLLYLSNNF